MKAVDLKTSKCDAPPWKNDFYDFIYLFGGMLLLYIKFYKI